ncbi:hypothetical protein CC80DRAFT_549315 [Byssothecium circinans]|uniref:Uncharacterized protein n=1 Tax=Byssothecium circinans TaxID=147558 RepID=A0A6A5TSI2_9PLEO|nr:hypothetical protein CC80DRAFT_549315 [Byssothecium circinans]
MTSLPKIRDLRRVLELWDFDKDYDEQDTSTIDLGEQLLLPHKKEHSWSSEANRAVAMSAALDHAIMQALSQYACRWFVRAHLAKNGPPKRKFPAWLDVPYIAIEEGSDVWGEVELRRKAEREALRKVWPDIACPQDVEPLKSAP